MSSRLMMIVISLLAAGSLIAKAQDNAEFEVPRDYLDDSATADPSIEAEETPEVAVFVRASGSSLVPRDGATAYSYGGAGCLQRNSGGGDGWFTYDLQVPDGATLDVLRIYYFDNNATFDVNSELWAFDGAGGATLIAEADSSGTPGYSTTATSGFSHTVDNANESLVVVVALPGSVGSSLLLCSIRVRYQGTPEPIFDDGFESGNTGAWDSVVPLN